VQANEEASCAQGFTVCIHSLITTSVPTPT
jgi:hypothetical protein